MVPKALRVLYKKQNKKEYKTPPECEEYIMSLFMSETTSATNYSIRSSLHNTTVEKQNKLALNPFDDKRMYSNPIQNYHGISTHKKTIVHVYIV